jgi:transcriptional regulator with XRE-family HTH domain
MARSVGPLARILQTYGIRRLELAAVAGVDTKTIARLCRGEYQGLKLMTLCRVALALGIAPAELVPGLAARPRSGGLVARARAGRSRRAGRPVAFPSSAKPP